MGKSKEALGGIIMHELFSTKTIPAKGCGEGGRGGGGEIGGEGRGKEEEEEEGRE